MIVELTVKLLDCFSNLYKRYNLSHKKYHEFYLKVDGFYFCNKRMCLMVIIKVRKKRSVEIKRLQEIINEKDYIGELHPADACILGMLANSEKNGLFKGHHEWQKIIKIKDFYCFAKSDPILTVSKRYTNQKGVQVTALKSNILGREIEIPTLELCKNQVLLYSIDPLQAISIGYDVGELFVRNFESQFPY